MAKQGFKVIDSDIHVVEPKDLWLRYLEPEFVKDDPRPAGHHPIFDLGLASQVDGCAAGIEQQGARFALQPAHHGAAHHAVLTGDPDEFIGQIE